MKKFVQHLFLLMKHTLHGIIIQTLLASSLFALNGNAQQSKNLREVRITLSFNNVTVQKSFEMLEDKSGFLFNYNSYEAAFKNKINGNYQAQSLYDILLDISRQAKVHFKQVNENITVTPIKKEKSDEDRIEVVMTETIPVTGQVISAEDGEGLPGVNVIVKGTSLGTVTDVEGKYTLDVPDENTVLVFSSVGYIQEEVLVGDQTIINITLVQDIKSLEEIVVVGYGTQKKVNLTGAVSSISSEDLDERPVANTANLLSGMAPGLQVTQASGTAGGDDPVITIRGIGTLNNSNPLVLVDGTESSMNDVIPSDIESISVLKDASAAAIYGSRAANGVILITTKRATEGLSMNYHGWVGVQGMAVRPEYVTDGALWMELMNEGWENGGQQPIFSQNQIDEYRNADDPLRNPNTDWFDVMAGDKAFMTFHSFTVSGGSETNRIRASFNYLNQDGIGLNNRQERYGLRINNENKLSKKITLGTNLYLRWSDIVPPIRTSAGNEALGLVNTPHMPIIQAPDGRWGGPQVDGIGDANNWVALASITDETIKEQHLQGQIYAGWDIFEDLRFDAKVALNLDNSRNNFFRGLLPTGGLWNFNTGLGGGSDRGEEARSSSETATLLTSFYTLTYNKTINDAHNFTVLGGYQLEQFRRERLNGSIFEFPSNSTPVLSAGLENPGVGQTIIEWSLQSMFGRLNYNFREKFLFEANIRFDGSSRFRDGLRWGVFPSFSGAWRISEEDFMQDISFLDDLKVRASWGQLGNQQIAEYPYQATYALNQNYSFGGNVALGIAQNAIANPDIQWETTTTYDIGVDVTTFGGRLNLTVDYFHRLTDGILIEQEIPLYLGWKDAPFENLAEVLNTGWEFTVSHRNRIGDFGYNVGANLTIQDNELTRYLSDIPFITGNEQAGEYVLQEGQPIYAIFGYRNIGVFQTQEQVDAAPFHRNETAPGDLIFEDLEADGVIDAQDREVIGNGIPRYLIGANFGFDYKNFDLSVILQGAYDVDVWTGVSEAFYPLSKGDRGQFHEVWLDRWTPENPSTEFHRLNTSYAFNALNSTFFVEDGSFLRIKNLQVGYNLPESAREPLKLQAARLYFSVENLHTFSAFSRKWGHDPERNARQFGLRIPNVRTMVFGVNVTF